MIDTDAKPKPYLRLLALVALLGIVRAALWTPEESDEPAA